MPILGKGDGMSYLDLLDEDRDLITYRKSLRRLAGSVTATLLFQQISFRSRQTPGRAFYKFKSPCDHELYNPGDSWTEELGFSEGEFDSAIKNIGTKLGAGQKPEDIVTDLDAPLEVQARHLVIYWTDIQRRTWYLFNKPLADLLVERIYNEPDLRVTKVGNPGLGKTATPPLRGPKGRFIKAGETGVDHTETTTEITTEISPLAADAAPVGGEKTEPEQPAPTPVPVAVPVVEQPTLYDTLPDNDPKRQAHLRLLGITNKDREDKRNGHRPRHPDPVINNEGLTQKLRTELVNILIALHGAEAMVEADEEELLLYQDMAEKFYKMPENQTDTVDKLNAVIALWDAEMRSTLGKPMGKKQFLQFASAKYADRVAGVETNGGGKTNARNGKTGTKHESTATGLVDAYIAKHGPITIDTPYPPDYKQWPTSERERFFNFKYPPQLLPEVSGGVEGE